MFSGGGRALNGLRGLMLTEPNQTPNATAPEYSSRATGDEFRGREGNSPDHQLRSPSPGSVGNDVELLEQPGGLLRSSHPLKSA